MRPGVLVPGVSSLERSAKSHDGGIAQRHHRRSGAASRLEPEHRCRQSRRTPVELRTEMPATQTKTNQNADLSAYVKLAYLLIGAASLVYFLLHMHSGGTLVAAAAQASISLVYGVTALIIVFGVVIV